MGGKEIRNMKNVKTRIILAAIISIIAVSFVVYPVAAATDRYAYESTYNSWLNSKVKAQGHVVFDPVGGACDYCLWVQAEAYSPWIWYDSQVQVKIYTQCKYWIKPPSGSGYYQWAAAPINIMQWDGVFDYNVDVPLSFDWSYGASAFGMSLGTSYDNSPSTNYGISQSTVGSWRYLGWFKSYTGSWAPSQKMTVAMYLQVNNDLASDYYDGVVSPDRYYRKIIDFRFKLEVKNLNTGTTHTYTLGDDVGEYDLPYIPLGPV